MSSTYLNNNNNTSTSTSSLANAFNVQAKAEEQESLTTGRTWNGDINYSSLGDNFESALLAFDQKMVLPEECRKERKLDDETKSMFNEYFDTITNCVTSLPDSQRAYAYGLVFRYLFYVRSVRVAGKKSRLLFYYLFERLHTIFPQTCVALIKLLPDFGYFGDLDILIEMMSAYPDVVAAAETTYVKYIDLDCQLIFGKSLAQVSKDEAQELNTRLKTLSVEEIRQFVNGRRLSLASKWFKREGKHNSSHRENILIDVYFPNGGIRDLQNSQDMHARQLAKKRINYCQMVFRYVISALSQVVLVGEQMMCETNEAHRTWKDIDHKAMPAKFVTKYRKALANEKLKEGVTEEFNETGNRHPLNIDRVECRKNLIASLLKGKLNGAMQDIDRLSKIVYDNLKNSYADTQRMKLSPSLSSTERLIIATQWNDMVAKLKVEINDIIDKDRKEAEEAMLDFIDPRNVVPVIDTSGSMHSAGVQDKAIGLGILASYLSTMSGCLISYSERPQVFHLNLNETKDVFDHFLTIMNGPTGLSTNIDSTYDCMLRLMESAGIIKTDFAMLFLTDGQFDEQVIFDKTSDYEPVYIRPSERFGQTAVKRLEANFADAGYNMPRTIFWNFNSQSPGFPASSITRGVQLVSGYSQTLMIQVFTGDYEYEVQEDGTLKVNVDPWTTFYKAITNPGYDPVIAVVAETGEGCLVNLASI